MRVHVGLLLGLAEAMLALDLDVVETVLEGEPHDLGALRLGRAVGDQRELDAELLEGVDRIMGARKDEHLLFAKRIEAIGKPSHQIDGQDAMTGLGQRRKSATHDLLPGLGQLHPPRGLGRCPEPAPGLDHRRGDLFRRERRKLAGKLACDGVPGEFGRA